MPSPSTHPGGRLDHVHWLGGGSGAGKSTIARRLAQGHGLEVYATDDAMREHTGRLTPDDAPYLEAFKAMDMDERWSSRTPEVMLDTFHWFRGEGFELIVEDLEAVPHDRPVVAEGFRLLPSRVAPLLADSHHAVWLLPTPQFRRAAFETRGTLWGIPNKTNYPERALQNLLERDRMFTDRLTEETARLDLPAVHVEVGVSEDDLVALVTSMLRL